MAPDPRCTAVAAAKNRSGLSYAAIAQMIGRSEQDVINICTGTTAPTTQEFKDIAKALNITEDPAHGPAHAAS